ncbi:helix-turn-helix transcriptional regulator [Mycobacterium sp. MS1601]|nr:helix-turn-helix transcriptional regulator [Mycobacterium sp. MS1601]
MRSVISGPLPDIADRFSRLLAPLLPHEALVIFTRECTGRPGKVSGEPGIVSKVTTAELSHIREQLDLGEQRFGVARVAGLARQAWVLRDSTDTLLVVVCDRRPPPAWDVTATVAAMFGIVADSIRHRVAQASPDYLAESRAASTERARTIAELTEMHEATLSTLLATLRSDRIDDRRARVIAREAASSALIAVRSVGVADRAISEEAVTTAFARLRTELCDLLLPDGVGIDLVEPPRDGRPLPGEVAFGARAMVRGVIEALTAQTQLRRLLVGWGCDGAHLLVEVRDQGSGDVDQTALRRQLGDRLYALRGRVDIDSVKGWGSRVCLSIPLDAPAAEPADHLLAMLNPREREVLRHVAVGKRNKAIGEQLGISESTVKFHVAAVLRKLGAQNRGEAAAIGLRAGALPATYTQFTS